MVVRHLFLVCLSATNKHVNIFLTKFGIDTAWSNCRLQQDVDQGSISPSFCKQLLHSKIPKAQKDSQVKQLFALLGPAWVKAAHKQVEQDEINPWPQFHQHWLSIFFKQKFYWQLSYTLYNCVFFWQKEICKKRCSINRGEIDCSFFPIFDACTFVDGRKVHLRLTVWKQLLWFEFIFKFQSFK